ncbi:MAG: SDR family oxidoreductase [Thermodesulfobacteriota bacterium]
MPLNLTKLEGKVALVTGGSNDLGEAISNTLSGAGASVIIHHFQNRARAEKTCKDIIEAGGSAAIYEADVSDKRPVASLFRFIKERFNRLDILVNNAHLPITRISFPDVKWEEHQDQIDVMLKGAFYCAQEAVSMMGEQGDGSVINILTSHIDRPVKGYSSYVTAASALAGFSRNLAAEVGDKGIRVNMIAPGFVLTGRTPNAPEHVQEAIANSTPLGRLAIPHDIAKTVLFFASELSGFITGCYLVVDGGYNLSWRP